jgi:hypothetical protein
MEDLMRNQTEKETQKRSESHPSSKFSFEEDLKRQNIHTMIEIYGEEYISKIENLTQ